MGIFNTLVNFVQDPPGEINIIMRERRLSLAFLGYITGALSVVMLAALESGQTMGALSFTSALLATLFFNLCVGYFFSSSAHLFLELTTGKGKAAGLFVLLGLSEFTKTLFVAYGLVSVAFAPMAAVRVLVVVAVLLLQLFFILFIMQKAYGLSKIRTFFALLVSFVPSIISLFALGMLFFTFIFWLIFK